MYDFTCLLVGQTLTDGQIGQALGAFANSLNGQMQSYYSNFLPAILPWVMGVFGAILFVAVAKALVSKA